jgi:hypothetical protein
VTRGEQDIAGDPPSSAWLPCRAFNQVQEGIADGGSYWAESTVVLLRFPPAQLGCPTICPLIFVGRRW